MQLFQINQSEESSKITIMSDTTCSQFHQRPITSASNYNRTYSKLLTVTPQQSAAPAPWDSATSSASRPLDLPGCVAPARSWGQNIFFRVNENIFPAWRTVTISNILMLGEYENIAVWCLAYHNSHPPGHSSAVVGENRFGSDPRWSPSPWWRPLAAPKLSPFRRNAAIFVNPS